MNLSQIFVITSCGKEVCKLIKSQHCYHSSCVCVFFFLKFQLIQYSLLKVFLVCTEISPLLQHVRQLLINTLIMTRSLLLYKCLLCTVEVGWGFWCWKQMCAWSHALNHRLRLSKFGNQTTAPKTLGCLSSHPDARTERCTVIPDYMYILYCLYTSFLFIAASAGHEASFIF